MTNLPVKGLSSTYRSVVAALMLTLPRQVPKSSTDDLAPLRHTYMVGDMEREPYDSGWPLHAPFEVVSSLQFSQRK